MKIQTRPATSLLAGLPSVASPKTPATLTPSRSIYTAAPTTAGAQQRLGLWGQSPAVKQLGGNSLAAPFTATAKTLARKADLLRQSDMPSDRLEAYQMIREAARQIKDFYPDLAKKLDQCASTFEAVDPAAKQYQEFRKLGASPDQANAWALQMYPEKPTPFLAGQNFDAVRGELNSL